MNRVPTVVLAMIAGAGLTLTVQSQLGRRPHRSATDPTEAVLATVDGQPITVTDFERELKRRGGPANFPRAEHRHALLDDMIQQSVLITNARRAGYDRDPDVRREMGYVLSGRYRQEHIDAELAKTDVSEEELRAYYETHPERYTIPESAHVALIYFSSENNDSAEHQQQIKESANTVRAAAEKQDSTSHFGALAAEHSGDQASRYRGGDIGWVARGQSDSRWEPALLEAIFALETPGTLSPLLTTEKGIYLIRLLDRKPASLRQLNEVAGAIHAQLLSEKRRQRSAELYAAAAAPFAIHVDEDRLAHINVPEVEVVEHQPPPPPVPQG